KIPTEQSIGTQRKDDRFFEPFEKVSWEFKNIYGVDGDNIDTATWEGKRLRGELLVLLKERAGLKYREIGEFNAFGDLSFTSLAGLYRRSKKTRGESE
ncbi:MAG: hypothetical protein GTO45_18995, partial [Candidatus Aminicenantes bacterium]|nr:hypothetical protein [Candidatus Aminicenantes bacterium]NIM80875.1 hypothetical protein [Candidatus Aminicenantes bacterium]NIN20259.1 hypothetical protein [Candidatus Aminicenantes bacterium]NIN44038.1 hypothetical protein [Candidatus Aminicenantes bacterium]NIN86848.1 hypothetical protein [Candidatus Aminicenantes bacterium]